MSYLGVPPFGQTVRTVTTQTANGSQSVFYPTGGYTVGYLDVFYNGVRVVEATDYTAGDGNSVTFAAAPTSNAVIEMVSYGPISFVDAVARSGDTLGGTFYVRDLIPAANNTYSLGNSNYRFANLYLSGNTIVLGNSTISANATSVSFANSTGGAADVVLPNTGVVANTYGHSTAIPVVTIDAQGRVTTVTLANTVPHHDTAYSNAVSVANTTSFNQAANAYANAISYADAKSANAYANVFNGGTFSGNVVFTSNVTANTVRLNGSMQIDGDLLVTGNTVTMNVTSLSVEDNMIYLNASSNVANPDLGIAGNYNDGTYRHAGVFRDATDGVWKFFHQYQPEPDASAYIDTSNNTFALANVQANTFIGAFSGSLSGNVVSNTANVTTSLTVGANSLTVGSALYLTANGYMSLGNTANNNSARLYITASDAASRRTLILDSGYPTVNSNATNYNHNFWVNHRNFPISSGVTDSGYRIGINVEGYQDNTAFQGTLNTYRGIWVRTGNYSNTTGTITNNYGIHIENFNNSGTITNNFGLYQEGSGTRNYLQGNTGFGTSTPYSTVVVHGDTHLTFNNSLYFGANTTAAGAWNTRMYASGGVQYINSNGFVVNDYGYTGTKTFIDVSSANRVGLTTAVDSLFELKTGRIRQGYNQRAILGWFDWHTGPISGTYYLHIKTNLWGGGSPGNTQPTMSYFHILGYDYRALTIDSKLGFHNWAGSIYSAASTNSGSLNISPAAYVSSDGYVVLRFDVTNASYMGLTINYYQAYGYSFQSVNVTATALTTSASNY